MTAEAGAGCPVAAAKAPPALLLPPPEEDDFFFFPFLVCTNLLVMESNKPYKNGAKIPRAKPKRA